MAGFVTVDGVEREFHIDNTTKSMAQIHKIMGFKKVVNIQVDGDELDAVLFGLAYYRKNASDLTNSLHKIITDLMRLSVGQCDDSPKIKDYSL